MNRLWQRLLRLWRQSQIRLGAALRCDAIRPGDRLQIGPRLWRVDRRARDGASLVLVADSANGRRGCVRLRFAGAAAARPWVLEDRGEELCLAAGDLLHFPVANGSDRSDRSDGSDGSDRSDRSGFGTA